MYTMIFVFALRLSGITSNKWGGRVQLIILKTNSYVFNYFQNAGLLTKHDTRNKNKQIATSAFKKNVTHEKQVMFLWSFIRYLFYLKKNIRYLLIFS